MDKLEQLITAHRDVYTSLLHLCEELPVTDWDRETGCPGWSVRDVLAHVVGVESVLAGDQEPAHELPPDLPHVTNEFGRYMEVHVDARRHIEVADLLLEARDVFSRRLGQIEAVADLEADLAGPMGSSAPAYRLLPVRVFDMWAHEQDIRRAVGRPGHLEGPAPEVSLDRIFKALAALLGRRAEVTGRIVLSVTGDREVAAVIDGASGGLDRGEESPFDVRLVMPFADLVSRACGRTDAPGPELVLIEGDADLGKRVLAEFAITP